jgi:hypothetical protein
MSLKILEKYIIVDYVWFDKFAVEGYFLYSNIIIFLAFLLYALAGWSLPCCRCSGFTFLAQPPTCDRILIGCKRKRKSMEQPAINGPISNKRLRVRFVPP